MMNFCTSINYNYFSILSVRHIRIMRSSALIDLTVARGKRVIRCGLPRINLGHERNNTTSQDTTNSLTFTNIIINIVFIFLIFGTLLEASGAGPTLLKFAFLATRKMRGGPAHAAILSSSLFGTMSGSPVANIVGTGTFTIPMIRKRGFSPAFAAGIEATASSGGQIMPPIMGAAALVMADITSTSYLKVIIAALLPAILYYFSLFASVIVEARRQGISPEPLAAQDRLTRQDLINSIMFIVPITTIIIALLLGYSTSFAGYLAIISLIIVSVVNPDVRKNPLKLFTGMLRGANSTHSSSISLLGRVMSL